MDARVVVWIMIIALLVAGYKGCWEKSAMDPAVMISFAMLYIGMRIGYWEANRHKQGQN